MLLSMPIRTPKKDVEQPILKLLQNQVLKTRVSPVFELHH